MSLYRFSAERIARAWSAENAAFWIECWSGKSEADRYREEIRTWIQTGISPYVWDNAMPMVRECAEEAE